MKALSSHLIDLTERKLGQSMDYLRFVSANSRAAIWKFFLFVPFSAHGRDRDKEVLTVARIAASLHEDCGACVQIAADDAVARGVDPELVRAALEADRARLSSLHSLVFRFADAVARAQPEAEDLRLQLARRLPERTMVDLALAIATARVFPSIKRALGYSSSCSRASVHHAA